MTSILPPEDEKTPRQSCSVPEDPDLGKDHFFQNVRFCWLGKNYLLAIDNQGYCCCCWAFSATEAITVAYALKNGGIIIPLSKQQLIDCMFHYSKMPARFANLEKNACFPYHYNKAYESAVDHGIIEENKYKYTEARGECYCSSDVEPVKIKKFERVPEGMKKHSIEKLIEQQPLTCRVRHVRSLQQHRGEEIYQGPNEDEVEEIDKSNDRGDKAGWHAMLIIGYGEEKGEEFYLAKNSWG